MSTNDLGYNSETLLAMLHLREVEIKFHKENGDLRVLRGTLNGELIPLTAGNTNTSPKQQVKTITVWDLDNADWRSFRVDRVIDVL